MNTLVVLLRGINVGRANRLAMADLRATLTGLGAQNVVTHLQSGQAVLDLPGPDVAGFAERAQAALLAEHGLDVSVLTRTPDDLAEVVAGNPYPHLVATPKQLFAAFLDATPGVEWVAAAGRRHGGDEFTVGDRVLYLAFGGSSHDSPLVPVLRRLGGVQTARNWNTVTRLLELAVER